MSHRRVPTHFVVAVLCLLILQGCILLHNAPSVRTKTTTSTQPSPSAPSPTASLAPITAPPTDCPHYPLGGFNDVWRRPEVYPRLGCAVAPSEAISGTAANLMGLYSRWLGEKRLFLVLYDKERRWRFIPDGSGQQLDAQLMIWPAPETPTPGMPAPLITPAPTPTAGLGTPEAPTATTTPPGSTETPLPTAPAIPRATWPRGLFPASGRHEWLARAALSETHEVIWSGTAETPFRGALQEFQGGWLFWDGSTCFVLFEEGTFILCP